MRYFLILALAATPVAAQRPGTLPLVPLLPGSTRALGLGGAYPIGATDSDAIFYNPAVNERLRGASLAVQWAGSAATHYTLSAGIDWWGGALGLGVMATDYHTTVSDTVFPADSPARLLVRGESPVSERTALLSYGRRIKGLRLAATGKLLEQRVQTERNVTAALDVATALNISHFTVGLSARNLGPGIEYLGRDYDLPLRAALNASSNNALPAGPFDLGAAAEVSWTRHGEVVPAGGIELSYWPVAGRTFSLRAGGRRPLDGEKPFTLGGGFTGDRISIDYAFVPYDDGEVHRVGVRWR